MILSIQRQIIHSLILSSILFCGKIALAQETINSFHSHIQVHLDGSMTVTETITVTSWGQNIKHGIYRDFPTDYKDPYGNHYVVNFQVNRVTRDGIAEEYFSQQVSNGKRVYIGRKNYFLPQGKYTYKITYETNRQLGFFKDFDELYWNVTGNGWEFPIEEARATIELPPGASHQILEMDAYTGLVGAKGKDFSVSQDYTRQIHFQTNRFLAPKEGLTIVVKWPKGFVHEPTPGDKIQYVLDDNKETLVGVIGLILVLAYYISVWNQFGRDPPKGTIIPLYDAPHNFSPAMVRYTLKMGFDQKILTATIIQLAVKGFIKIEEDSVFTIKKAGGSETALSPEERLVAEKLFAGSDSVILKNTNHHAFKNATSSLKDSLNKSCEKIYFLTNRKYFFPGLFLSIATMMVAVFLQSGERFPIACFLSFWLSFWTIGVASIVYQAGSMWRKVFQARNLKDAMVVGPAVFISLFAAPFVFFEILGIGFFVYSVSLPIMVIIAVLVSTNILFYNLLKAPTFQGRRIMDQIEGFKMFLSVTEKDSSMLTREPPKTPQTFEKYLPYAMALDVEQNWAEKFSDVLAQASQPGQGYSPAWYHNPTHPYRSPLTFATNLGSSFSTAIASSSVSPGSRSGGGGSGSSGRGGGGGGGGGW